MTKKHKNACSVLKYFEQFLILISVVRGFFRISAFLSLVCIHAVIASSAIGLNICVLAATIKDYKSINEKKKGHDEKVLLANTELNVIEVLIYKSVIVSLNNVLIKYG